jgi:hypothetical protein
MGKILISLVRHTINIQKLKNIYVCATWLRETSIAEDKNKTKNKE